MCGAPRPPLARGTKEQLPRRGSGACTDCRPPSAPRAPRLPGFVSARGAGRTAGVPVRVRRSGARRPNSKVVAGASRLRGAPHSLARGPGARARGPGGAGAYLALDFHRAAVVESQGLRLVETPVHGFGPGQPRGRPRSSGAAETPGGGAPRPRPGPCSLGRRAAPGAAGPSWAGRAPQGLQGRAREERRRRRRAPPHLPAPAPAPRPRPAPPPSPAPEPRSTRPVPRPFPPRPPEDPPPAPPRPPEDPPPRRCSAAQAGRCELFSDNPGARGQERRGQPRASRFHRLH
ncbi:hypothetical protein P7K49_027833 [Saguinus oedipus]|uniref:Basic proline-rich protein-like n=1 Tax=Saguinus oedipus TaxID=9490 RepID=A0ABQ9UBI5_SAGOE|nr:hypothetical protein P7K49_027833 [Saguinus oedipus]